MPAKNVNSFTTVNTFDLSTAAILTIVGTDLKRFTGQSFSIDSAGNVTVGPVGANTLQARFNVLATSATTVTLANCLADYVGNVDGYTQINVRNSNAGVNGSGDIIVTSNNGTDTTNFIDLGINNSAYSVGTWTINGALDGYLYTQSSSLAIGTAASTKNIQFFVGGTLAANEVMRVVSLAANNSRVNICNGGSASSITISNSTLLELIGTAAAQRGLRISTTQGTGRYLDLLLDGNNGNSIIQNYGGSLDVVSGTNSALGVRLTSGATAWAAISDERDKEIIETISNATEKVSSLRAVIGKYKNDSEKLRRSFLIAQDVQSVLPEAVDIINDDKKTLALKYSDIIPLLVAAIKELKTEIDILKNK